VAETAPGCALGSSGREPLGTTGRRDDGTTFGEGGGGEGWVNGDDGLLLEENHGRCDIF